MSGDRDDEVTEEMARAIVAVDRGVPLAAVVVSHAEIEFSSASRRALSGEPRGLEGTGITSWEERHTEHIARRAAELADDVVEALCDDVLAGLTSPQLLIDLLDSDPAYREWLDRGINLGWETRA